MKLDTLLPFGLLVLALSTPTARADEIHSLRHTRSAVLTEPVPDVPFGAQVAPRLRKTELGYCAAWIDHRQGGMVMLARLDATGGLIDQFGVPASPVESETLSPWKVGIISREGRCTVTHSVGFSVMGLTVKSEGPPEPERFEFFDSGSWYWQVSGNDGERALISVHLPAGLDLRLVDPTGLVLWSHTIETDYYQVRGVVRGTTAYILVQPQNRSGHLDLWKLTPDGVTRFDTTVLSSKIYHWDVVDEGDSFLVIDLDPAAEEGSIRFDRITDTGKAIDSWFPEHIPDAFDVIQAWSTEGGAVHVLTSSHEAMRLLRVKGTDVREAARIEGVWEAAMTRDASPMSLWGDRATGKMLYRFGLPSFGPGEPVTASPRLELVADAAPARGKISVLWTEASPAAGVQILLHGTLNPDTLSLTDIQEVSTGQVVGGDHADELSRATIAASDETLQMAWIEGAELKIRQRNEDGTWRGEAKILSVEAHTLHPDGLTTIGDRFLLVWTDIVDRNVWPEQTVLRAVWIDQEGSVELADPTGLEDAWHLSWPSATRVGDRIIITMRGEPQICRILCGPLPWFVRFMAVETEGRWSNLAHDDVTTSAVPTAAASGDTLILLGDEITRFRLTGDALVTGDSTRQIPPTRRGLPWRDRFVVASRQAVGHGAKSRSIVLTTSDDLEESVVQAVIDDASDVQSFPFLPALVELGQRIYVISSEVTLVPEEGTVRRLRVHELAPVHERKRGTRRR
ncbi:MAG: hypothetical protein KY432_04215 [Acidobacteria bacterium]|nr:hypothetical protein [Acidobacteriota bacterium]